MILCIFIFQIWHVMFQFYSSPKRHFSRRKVELAAAQFFKIETSTGQVSYLLGTIHQTSLPLRAVTQHFANPLKVLPYVDSVYAEINLQNEIMTLESFIDGCSPSTNPAINSLDDETRTILLNRIAKHVPQHTDKVKNLSLTDFSFVLFNTIVCEPKSMSHEDQKRYPTIIDVERMFVDKAKVLNKNIGGLEDHSRQLMFEDEPVQAMINGMKKFAASENTIGAIFYQNLLAFIKLINIEKFMNVEERLFGACPLEEQYFNHKLTDVHDDTDRPLLHRNRNMLLKIQEKMLHEKCLFMIGFRHLHGQNGLLQMLYDKGYRVTSLSRKNIHEEVETLKRQAFSTFLAFLALYMGVTSVMSGDIVESISPLILSGLICYGIYERTHFLQVNNILTSLSICQTETSNETYEMGNNLYLLDEENESEHISKPKLG